MTHSTLPSDRSTLSASNSKAPSIASIAREDIFAVTETVKEPTLHDDHNADKDRIDDLSIYASIKEDSFVDADFLVRFDENDPENPLNWSLTKRWVITLVAAFLILNATIASSVPAGVLPQMQVHFGFSREVGALCLSLFVLGFAVGPILWGPMSEDFGRQPVSLISFPLFIGTQIGCALSPNTASILIFRFLGGVFGASYLTTSGGIIADMFDGKLRGRALGAFSLAPFAGPSLAPLISGWMSVAGVGWQWVFWMQSIYGGVCLFLVLVAQPETYKPILLVHKARLMRKQTKDGRWWAPLERKHHPLPQRIQLILTRPFQMLATEPMLVALTVYLSFAYGVIYLLFEAYPIVFTVGHQLNAGISSLTYLPVPIGGAMACILYFIFFDPKYQHAVETYHPLPPPPEYRLPTSLYGSVLMPISFFWFAWTSYPSISFWAPMMAGLPLGMAVVLLYLGLYSYMFDAYTNYAASALAATVITRSFFGAGFPLFATQMYEKLTPRWASTLLAIVSLVMAPVPFVLQKYGPTLRARSKNAPQSVRSVGMNRRLSKEQSV